MIIWCEHVCSVNPRWVRRKSECLPAQHGRGGRARTVAAGAHGAGARRPGQSPVLVADRVRPDRLGRQHTRVTSHRPARSRRRVPTVPRGARSARTLAAVCIVDSVANVLRLRVPCSHAGADHRQLRHVLRPLRHDRVHTYGQPVRPRGARVHAVQGHGGAARRMLPHLRRRDLRALIWSASPLASLPHAPPSRHSQADPRARPGAGQYMFSLDCSASPPPPPPHAPGTALAPSSPPPPCSGSPIDLVIVLDNSGSIEARARGQNLL